MKKMIVSAIAFVFGVWGASASELTSISVSFKESAPKDIFVIRNIGNCHVKPMELKINLAASQGQLIFDPTASGAGVEVFQPFEVTDGRQLVSKLPRVRDGDDQLKLTFLSLPPKWNFAFTIDVDDTLIDSKLGQIRVANAEIKGAVVSMQLQDKSPTLRATFSSDAVAVLRRVPCGSS